MGLGSYKMISLPKQQCVVTHTILQTDIPALPDSWLTNAPAVKISCPQNIACHIFAKTKNT